jgi:dipeptidyl aminopeptidase/acylaminoacyl peptidase
VTTTPYGAWGSPITPELLVAGAVSLGEVQADGDDLWWSEARPEEGGRVQIVRRRPDGTTTDVLPDGFAARTRVHEYGGGAWTVHEGTLYFTNWQDQRLYRLDDGGDPQPLTPGGRYADPRMAPDGTWLAVVRETHGEGEAVNEIVAVAVDGSGEQVLVTGPDFVASPRPAPDGRLAWLQWDHPDMPWDAAELLVRASGAPVGGGENIAGGNGESVFQPEWAEDGSLWFTSDRTGWSELYRWADGGIEQMTETDAEIGTPQWQFGMSRYALLDDGPVYAALHDGRDHLLGDDRWTMVSSVVRTPRGIAAVASTLTEEQAVIGGPPGGLEVIRPPRDLGLPEGSVSVPEAIDFPSAGGRTAHALWYPPTNPDHAGPDGEAPPLLVEIHGGPTAAARPRFQIDVQFWTSRGFGVVDVNYGGSIGYGRDYRELLRGQWGIVDVEDCVAAARYLADRGDVDPDRLAIRGGSAGGFTTLAALAFHDTFAAGVNMFGVADLAVLAHDTHKFESRYLDGLVGPWPEAEAVYRERSPLHHADDIDVPLLVLQGLEDEVVPPNQSELIVDALRGNGVPVAYLAFEGEQHGFRKAETIIRATEAELSFYGQVFGFEPAGDVEPLVIENWGA